MRDLFAGVVAVVLLFLAAGLGTTLHRHRRRRQRTRDSEQALGRRVIVEIPGARDFVLFSEDAVRFYYGESSIDKDLIVAVRVLVNGAPLAQAGRPAAKWAGDGQETPPGIMHDRWDVEIETLRGATLIECGAIRERVSQDVARAVFDAVERELERRGRPSVTTRSPAPRPDD